MTKRYLLLSAVLLICAVVFAVAAEVTPVEKSTELTLANYSHRGQFSYTAYGISDPDSAGQPSTLYPKIMESLEILFACSTPQSDPPRLRLILEDKSAGWQKEIPITVSAGPVFAFPLDVNGILKLGNTINTELGGRGGAYLIRVEAVGAGDEPLTAVLEGDLSASALAWHEAGFQKVERGFPAGDTLRWAAFGFRVKLTENSLFGPIFIERAPAAPKVSPIGQGHPLLTSEVEYVDIGLGYELSSDPKFRSMVAKAQVDLTLSESGGWTKTYTLAGPVEKDGAFSLSMPVDIGKLVEMADSNDEEVGGRAAQDRQITVTAQVRTHALTDAGVIDEVFRQQLTGKMGKSITWDAADKGGTSLLALVRPGKITSTTTSVNTSVRLMRLSSVIVLVIGGGLFAFLLPVYFRTKPRASLLDGLKANRKKYGELISEVASFPEVGRGGPVTTVPSLDSLARISNNSLKPVLLKIDGDRHAYRVIDGAVTYEYISTAGVEVEGPSTVIPSLETQ